jgi:hypothetical protein
MFYVNVYGIWAALKLRPGWVVMLNVPATISVSNPLGKYLALRRL